jgi:hypothetical protein
MPKCAGSSIRHGIWHGAFIGPLFHEPIPWRFRKYLKFTLIRNPYDRFLSALKMFTHGSISDPYKCTQSVQNLTVELALNILEDDSIPYSGSRDDPIVNLKHHILPLTHPFNRIDEVNFIGRHETIDQDWRTICFLAKQLYSPLPYLMKSNEPVNSRSKFNDQLFNPSLLGKLNLKRFNQIFDSDFESFGYPKYS